MKLYNLKDHTETVNFLQAVKMGLGKKQGLFFPTKIPKIDFNMLEELINMNFLTRSIKILSMFIGNEIEFEELKKYVYNAFSFTDFQQI